MKLMTIVGARPQFIKAAAVEHAIRTAVAAGAGIRSVLVHTGQHYDHEMSQVFFDELGLQAPDYDLGIGSGSHGAQTGQMLEAVESVMVSEKPDVVLVYGDTNSTLAGALAAAKLNLPIAHVEAGLRSYNRRMPEELNRVLTDHVSAWLFCPTETAAANLQREGIVNGVHVVGDVMYELTVQFAGAGKLPDEWRSGGIERDGYVLATLHRAENTDDEARLRGIVGALVEISETVPVMVPLHPRTRKTLKQMSIEVPDRVHLVNPLGYGRMIAAEEGARVIVTDSGGVQKEAFWLGVPCVTVRGETEWLESLDEDRNVLAGSEKGKIVAAIRAQLSRGRLARPHISRSSAGSDIVRLLS